MAPSPSPSGSARRTGPPATSGKQAGRGAACPVGREGLCCRMGSDGFAVSRPCGAGNLPSVSGREPREAVDFRLCGMPPSGEVVSRRLRTGGGCPRTPWSVRSRRRCPAPAGGPRSSRGADGGPQPCATFWHAAPLNPISRIASAHARSRHSAAWARFISGPDTNDRQTRASGSNARHPSTLRRARSQPLRYAPPTAQAVSSGLICPLHPRRGPGCDPTRRRSPDRVPWQSRRTLHTVRSARMLPPGSPAAVPRGLLPTQSGRCIRLPRASPAFPTSRDSERNGRRGPHIKASVPRRRTASLPSGESVRS
jgi:hypothetical protein